MDLRAGQQERPGQALAEGQKVTDTIVITVDDGKGGKATQTVTVEVTGTNDAPTIGGTATGAVKEDAVVNTTSGQLTKTDVDTNDVHTWSVANNGNGQYGKFTVDQTGKWTYTLDNSNAKVQALAEGQTATDTIIVTVNDGKGGTATQEITVTITGTNDAPTIGGVATGAVTEDAAVTIVTGQLTKTDVDATDTHTWSIANNGNGQYGKFTLDQTGKWTYVLDNGSTRCSPWPRARRSPTPSPSRSATARAARRPRTSLSPSRAPMTTRPLAASPPAR